MAHKPKAFRFTDAELAAWRSKALKIGITNLSDYIRLCCNEYLSQSELIELLQRLTNGRLDDEQPNTRSED